MSETDIQTMYSSIPLTFGNKWNLSHIEQNHTCMYKRRQNISVNHRIVCFEVCVIWLQAVWVSNSSVCHSNRSLISSKGVAFWPRDVTWRPEFSLLITRRINHWTAIVNHLGHQLDREKTKGVVKSLRRPHDKRKCGVRCLDPRVCVILAPVPKHAQMQTFGKIVVTQNC